MNLPTQLFVDGTFRDSKSGRRSALTNPATEAVLGEVAAADLADVSSAIESAHRAWESGWRDLAPGDRKSVV